MITFFCYKINWAYSPQIQVYQKPFDFFHFPSYIYRCPVATTHNNCSIYIKMTYILVAIVIQNVRWRPHPCIIRHIFLYHTIGTNHYVISNMNISKYFSPRKNTYIITNNRSVRLFLANCNIMQFLPKF